MESSHFDILARLLGAGHSRRRLVSLLAGLASGGVGHPLLDLSVADAKKKKKKKRKSNSPPALPPASPPASPPPPPPPSPPPCVCSTGCPFTKLQAAVDAALTGATITICAGTFFDDVNIDKDLTLIGAGEGANPAANTVIDGATLDLPVVRIRPGRTVDLQNMRITGGSTNNLGAGIINQGTLTLTACTVTGNFAGNWGGGIYNFEGGKVTLVNSSVMGNHAGVDGGGIYNSGTVTCSGSSTVSGNTAGPCCDPPPTNNCSDVSPGTGCATCPA